MYTNLDFVIMALEKSHEQTIVLDSADIPKALVRAIEYYTKQKTWKKEDLIEFIEANRDIFEPICRSGRFLPPFAIDFSEVSKKLQELFIIMFKKAGIKNPGDYIYLSQQKRGYGYADALIVAIPISSSETHLLAVTTRARRWYIPPSKAQENLNQLVKQVKGVKGKIRREMRNVQNETFVLIGRYTSGVRGAFKQKGSSEYKRAALVFDDQKRNWYILLTRFLNQLFSKRLSRLMEKLEGRSEKIYGEVAERVKNLGAYLSVFDEFVRIRAVLG